MMIRNIVVVVMCSLSYCFAQPSGELVLPGDYPDPSVVKIGDSYWATATTSNWGPVFPLLESRDLHQWQTRSFVFNKLPDWADYYFWAPEITYENGTVYVFYSAHKKGGNLCLGVASSNSPTGPFVDHGPLMCEEAGSIDAFTQRDENGKLFIIWKEDGNSVRKPTPIWAAALSEDRTKIIGEKKELFRNDAPWEQNLVEGVSMIRHGEYFYAFYAGAGCCGQGCTYATGIARSKNLLGPWEKYNNNPILSGDEEWKCPGHGTAVETDGKYYFLYHAYNKQSDVHSGRQGILQEFTFNAEGWIEFLPGTKTSSDAVSKDVNDNFEGNQLSPVWQWSVFNPAKTVVENGKLSLSAASSTSGAFIAAKNASGNYEAVVHIRKSTAQAGLAAIGDDKNLVRALVSANEIVVSTIRDDKEEKLFTQKISWKSAIFIKMKVVNANEISFYTSNDGKTFSKLNQAPIDGSFLPPWDRAVRVGIVAKGEKNQTAIVERFSLTHQQ